MSRPAPVPIQPLSQGVPGSFTEIKRPEHETDYSPASSAQVKNKWSYSSSPHTRLRRVDRKNFILLQKSLIRAWSNKAQKSDCYVTEKEIKELQNSEHKKVRSVGRKLLDQLA